MNTIFLTFGNDEKAPLETLKREDDLVYSTLVNRQLRGDFIIHRESLASMETINKNLGVFEDRICVFLYSGHANAHSIQLNGQSANAKGIAYQLGVSAKKGNLKLVVLNGCSTVGQVAQLLKEGVPAVVATSAPVEDQSATEFSIRFFQNLSEKRMTIRDAFKDALGPAQSATKQELKFRDTIDSTEDAAKSDEPVWGLFANDSSALDSNPLPTRSANVANPDFVVNEKLKQTLFDTLLEAQCERIIDLKKEMERGYVEPSRIYKTCYEVLPFPIAIHLQKLFTPVDDENEGFDKVNLRRVEQIARVYHTTVEFLTFVMLAQLWELKLNNISIKLDDNLLQQIQAYFYLSTKERAVYDYLPLIRKIRLYFDSTESGTNNKYFITELVQLEELKQEGQPFDVACGYLTYLRKQAYQKSVPEADVPVLCEEAENNLCTFFASLGFLHRYELTSIQNIDIQKYRHQLTAEYKHAAIRLMSDVSNKSNYLLSHFLDNRGVILLKNIAKWDMSKNMWVGEKLDYLNLSPFVIDRNAFDPKTDLSNLLFYEQSRQVDKKYLFKSVKQPDTEYEDDHLEVSGGNTFDAVNQQLNAFRSLILNETL